MKQPSSAFVSLERACFRVVALVVSRVAGRDIHSEFARLETQSKSRSYIEVCATLSGLLVLTVAATSLGIWALAALFIGLFLLFR